MQTQVNARGTTRDLSFRAIVVTQFLTTFNDNAFRMSVILLAFRAYADIPEKARGIASLSTILFLLPYALLSLLAGILADRYSKRSVFILWKSLEIPMVAAGLVGLVWAVASGQVSGWPMILMLTMLTGLGLQTAFLAPSRYGILPEYLDDRELSRGNGNLELGSYFGILSGTMAGGLIVEGLYEPASYGWALGLMPIAAILGAIASLFVPKVSAANPGQMVLPGLDPRQFLRNWRVLESRRGLVPTVWGLTIFWGVSTLYVINAPSFGSEHLGFAENSLGNNWLLVAISVGIGGGSWAAGRLSRGTIELGLVPIGSLLWLLASIGLGCVSTFWPTVLLLAVAGMAGGLFVVPLNAFLEKYSPPQLRASCIATSNIVTVLGMIAACVWNLVAATLQLDPKTVFLSAGVILLVATFLIFRKLPDFLIRFGLIVMMRTFYKIHITGKENVPQDGPALLVFNHTSFADGNLIVSCFDRFVRFVVYRGHYKSRILRFLGETMQAIPVDSEAPPKEIVRSLRRASDALNRGELVCIFAEGGISRTGFLLPFFRGIEMILKRAPGVPIIPGYIDGMWGSVFSFQRGKFFWKWPRGLRYPVHVRFGQAMPSDSTVQQVRQQVQLVGTECFAQRIAHRLALHRQFVRTARRHARHECAADSNTPMINYGTALMRSVVLRRLLARRLGPEEYVGLLVPPSVPGMLANIALAYLGRVQVNLNYTTGVDVVNACIHQCGIRQVITSRRFMERVGLDVDAELIYLEDFPGQVGVADRLFALAARILPGWITEHWLLKLGKHSIDDLATIVFSSGSTGMPKGVMLTHYNLVANIESVVQMIDATERDRVMGVLPFFHSFGYTITLWLPLTIHATNIYHYNPLEAEVVGKMIAQYRASIFISTATFLRGYIRKCAADDFQTLRLLVCGAEKLPTQVAEQFEKKFGILPLEGYGCTELSPAVSVNRPNVVYGSYHQTGHKPGTIGHPMPGIAVRVIDPETNQQLPVGAEGLLQVKGPNVMKGYLHRPDLTAEVVRDGWYSTGDIAKLDEDGFITITDRISRFSKIAGEMVPHGKVEEMIHEALGTHERVCVVIGIPDERKGERLVVLHSHLPMSVDELWNELKQRGLPTLWLPAKTAFFEVPEIPILGSGKTDLKAVKTIAHQKLDA